VDLKVIGGGLVALYIVVYTAHQFLRRGPRQRLTVDDWEPRGWLGTVVLACAALLYGGGWVLFAPRQTFRLGGGLALAAGLALLAGIISYVRRPALSAPAEAPRGTAADARLPPFRRSPRGYDPRQVDEFFTQICSKQVAEIEAIRFKTRLRGYRPQDVDRALDGWQSRQRASET
jgi:DivIVA domain-containing protein